MSNETFNLWQNRIEAAGTRAPSHIGNNAIGAIGVAPILHFYKSPSVPFKIDQLQIQADFLQEKG